MLTNQVINDYIIDSCLIHKYYLVLIELIYLDILITHHILTIMIDVKLFPQYHHLDYSNYF